MAEPGPRRLDHGMAAAAALIVPDPLDDDTRTRLRQLPVMLHTAGLATTLGYLNAKAGDSSALDRAYKVVSVAMSRQIAETLGMDSPASPEAVLKRLDTVSAPDHEFLSAQARALAEWLSRIAEGRPRARQGNNAHTAGSVKDGDGVGR